MEAMERILIVEDNESYMNDLYHLLNSKGYEVATANNPIAGFETFAKGNFDLVISDLVMKEFDGMRYLTAIKNIDPMVSTMILTANPDDETEMSSLETDIDLYISKSKSMDVILKYIEVLLKKRQELPKSDDVLLSKAEGIMLFKNAHKVTKNNEEIALTPREYQILKFFLENKNVTMSREDIINAVWGNPVEEIEERVIDLHIKNIRSKLGIVSLITVRGFGYKWNE